MAIFQRLRAYLASKQEKRGGPYDLVSCVACVSVWIGALAALWASGDVFSLVMYTLAFSAIAVLLEHFIHD